MAGRNRSGRRGRPSLTPARGRREGRERGSATLEAVIIVPALLLFAALVVGAGRVALARQAIELAAWEAVRAASIERTLDAAGAAANRAASASLAAEGLNCGLSTALDAPVLSWTAPETGEVSVTVTCVIPLGDLAVPGLPGAVTLSATAASPFDTFREFG
jgi:Flp pilus assembly protein TadG